MLEQEIWCHILSLDGAGTPSKQGTTRAFWFTNWVCSCMPTMNHLLLSSYTPKSCWYMLHNYAGFLCFIVCYTIMQVALFIKCLSCFWFVVKKYGLTDLGWW